MQRLDVESRRKNASGWLSPSGIVVAMGTSGPRGVWNDPRKNIGPQDPPLAVAGAPAWVGMTGCPTQLPDCGPGDAGGGCRYGRDAGAGIQVRRAELRSADGRRRPSPHGLRLPYGFRFPTRASIPTLLSSPHFFLPALFRLHPASLKRRLPFQCQGALAFG
jgi:hypothetical protein